MKLFDLHVHREEPAPESWHRGVNVADLSNDSET
jgi:hypothetical protein